MRREFALLFFFPEIDFETYLKIQLKQVYIFSIPKGAYMIQWLNKHKEIIYSLYI